MDRLRVIVAAGLSVACGAASAASLEFRLDVPGAFIDIRATGTRLPLTSDGSVPVLMTVSNGLYPAGTVWVGNNGGVGFAGDPTNPLPSTTLAPGPAPLPSSLAFGGGQCALPWWDDPGEAVAPPAGVYFQEVGGLAIFQWDHVPVGGGGTATFELQIIDGGLPRGLCYSQYIYQDINGVGGGARATVGYQDGINGSFETVLWGFRGDPHNVQDEMVLSLCDTRVPAPATAGVLACGGLVAARRRRRVG